MNIYQRLQSLHGRPYWLYNIYTHYLDKTWQNNSSKSIHICSVDFGQATYFGQAESCPKESMYHVNRYEPLLAFWQVLSENFEQSTTLKQVLLSNHIVLEGCWEWIKHKGVRRLDCICATIVRARRHDTTRQEGSWVHGVAAYVSMCAIGCKWFKYEVLKGKAKLESAKRGASLEGAQRSKYAGRARGEHKGKPDGTAHRISKLVNYKNLAFSMDGYRENL